MVFLWSTKWFHILGHPQLPEFRHQGPRANIPLSYWTIIDILHFILGFFHVHPPEKQWVDLRENPQETSPIFPWRSWDSPVIFPNKTNQLTKTTQNAPRQTAQSCRFSVAAATALRLPWLLCRRSSGALWGQVAGPIAGHRGWDIPSEKVGETLESTGWLLHVHIIHI